MKNEYNDSLFYKILRPILKFFFLCLYTPKIVGKENIPRNGRIILAGTHVSVLDCIMLMSSTKRGIHFLAKAELFKGIKGIIFSNLGLIPVNRKIHDSSVLERAENYLKNGKVIGIFPEGTTEKGKGLLPFKIGAVKMAYDTETMIVPFVIKGKYRLFSRNLRIVFDKPIKIKNSNLEKENMSLRDKIYSMMEDDK